MIRVTNLVKNYAGFPAVRGISFEVATGEVVGFLGPNGAGKTTTLRILSGFMPASGGTMEVAGFDVAEQSREVRSRMGYLAEEVPLYRDMTVRSYLAYLAGLKEVPAAGVNREVDRVIELTGLEEVCDRLVGKCSKGYRQRTGLAQALLGDPPVLLLDEPTSGLDPNQVVSVRALIRDLSGEKTVLLSSHILPEVTQICERVLIINQGRLVGAGTPAELAARTLTRETLTLRVDRPLPEGALDNVPGLLGIEPGDGEYVLEVDSAEEAAPEVARRVIAAGCGIRTLTPGAADLEAVFRDLTGADHA